jgi:hypothetical protein
MPDPRDHPTRRGIWLCLAPRRGTYFAAPTGASPCGPGGCAADTAAAAVALFCQGAMHFDGGFAPRRRLLPRQKVAFRIVHPPSAEWSGHAPGRERRAVATPWQARPARPTRAPRQQAPPHAARGTRPKWLRSANCPSAVGFPLWTTTKKQGASGRVRLSALWRAHAVCPYCAGTGGGQQGPVRTMMAKWSAPPQYQWPESRLSWRGSRVSTWPSAMTALEPRPFWWR